MHIQKKFGPIQVQTAPHNYSAYTTYNTYAQAARAPCVISNYTVLESLVLYHLITVFWGIYGFVRPLTLQE